MQMTHSEGEAGALWLTEPVLSSSFVTTSGLRRAELDSLDTWRVALFRSIWMQRNTRSYASQHILLEGGFLTCINLEQRPLARGAGETDTSRQSHRLYSYPCDIKKTRKSSVQVKLSTCIFPLLSCGLQGVCRTAPSARRNTPNFSQKPTSVH